MLFPQIPKKFIDDLSGELSVNLGMLKATLKDKGLTQNRLSKLDAVVRYIEKNHDVGDIASPKPYIHGKVIMHSVIFDGGMVLFCWSGKIEGSDKQYHLLLSGSTSHVIGMDLVDMICPYSMTRSVINRLSELRSKQNKIDGNDIKSVVVDVDNGNEEFEPYLEDIKRWSEYTKGPRENFEFLAKTLIHEEIDNNVLILATPLYIALSDQ